jgi:acetyltransferase-like isoleucine patch superfamily enzyme
VTIVCSQGELVIGKHSVIGANSMVTRSIPPYSIVSGNPARIVKQFDPTKNSWELGARSAAGSPAETESRVPHLAYGR